MTKINTIYINREETNFLLQKRWREKSKLLSTDKVQLEWKINRISRTLIYAPARFKSEK